MSSLNIWKWQQESQQVQLFLSLLLLHLEYDPVSPPSSLFLRFALRGFGAKWMLAPFFLNQTLFL